MNCPYGRYTCYEESVIPMCFLREFSVENDIPAYILVKDYFFMVKSIAGITDSIAPSDGISLRDKVI